MSVTILNHGFIYARDAVDAAGEKIHANLHVPAGKTIRTLIVSDVDQWCAELKSLFPYLVEQLPDEAGELEDVIVSGEGVHLVEMTVRDDQPAVVTGHTVGGEPAVQPAVNDPDGDGGKPCWVILAPSPE